MHASPLDRRNVNEHIRATVVLNDEAVTLLGIEKFNCTCGHNGLLIKRARRRYPYKPFAWVLISGILRVLGRAVKAETARSGAIANRVHIAMSRTHCNQRCHHDG